MESKNFEMLMEMMRVMENGSNIKGIIVRLIDNYESSMSDRQKKEIIEEFVRYEKMKSRKINSEKFDAIIEKENYRRAIENFMTETAS